MICDPSLLPIFNSPIFDTRQQSQPSMNFLAPIRTLILDSSSEMSLNIDPVNSSFSTGIPGSSSLTNLRNSASSPMNITPKNFPVPALSAISPAAFLRSTRCSLTAFSVWKMVFKRSSYIFSAEDGMDLRYASFFSGYSSEKRSRSLASRRPELPPMIFLILSIAHGRSMSTLLINRTTWRISDCPCLPTLPSYPFLPCTVLPTKTHNGVSML